MPDSEVGTPEAAEETAPAEAQAAPSAPDATATLQAQLRANDQARVKAQEEAKKLAADLEAARRELATRDEKDMSDLERTQRERDRFKADADAAKAENERLRLTQAFPHAMGALEPGDPVPSEAALARIEKGLTPAAPADAPETDFTPPPQPQKVRTAPAPQTADEAVAALGDYVPEQWRRPTD